MKPTKLITTFTLTSLITISQYSLGAQNSSVKQTSPNTTPTTAPDTTKQNPNQDTRHKREFKDALIDDIQLPTDDPAHKPENGYSSSSSPARKNNSRK